MPQLVYFPHSFVEDGGNDPTMAVSRRPGEALAQPKTAQEAIARVIISEFQAHAVGIILTASEAKSLLAPHITGIVAPARGLPAHSRPFYRGCRSPDESQNFLPQEAQRNTKKFQFSNSQFPFQSGNQREAHLPLPFPFPLCP